MRILDLALKLLGLSEAFTRWRGELARLHVSERVRVADYCVAIADCLGRAGDAVDRLQQKPKARKPASELARELGRLTGYLEDVTAALEDHLDGRKLAGLKRRLAAISHAPDGVAAAEPGGAKQLRQLAEAEGYFRALADQLRL